MSLVERLNGIQLIRDRLRSPPNAVDDPGIDLVRRRKSLTNGYTDMKNVIDTVCRHYSVPRAELISHRRLGHLIIPRQVAMCLGYAMTKLSLPLIGTALGGRDHTTILHGARKIEEMEKTDPIFAAEIELIRHRLRQGTVWDWSRLCFDRREI